MKKPADNKKRSAETGLIDESELPWAEIVPGTEVDAATAEEAGVPCFKIVRHATNSAERHTNAPPSVSQTDPHGHDLDLDRSLDDIEMFDREWEAVRAVPRAEPYEPPAITFVDEAPAPPLPLPVPVVSVAVILVAWLA